MTLTLSIRCPSGRRLQYVFSGITRVDADGAYLWVESRPDPPINFPLSVVAEIALDEDAGAID